MRKKYKIFDRNTIRITVIILILILILSGFLYYDFSRRIASGQLEDVGVIIFKYNVVQRKYDAQVVWEELNQSAPVQNRDTIFTGNVSDARIVLKSGAVIEVDEDSLIQLEIIDDEANIRLDRGSLRLVKSRKEGGDVIITSDNKKVSLQSGDMTLRKYPDKSLDISVQKGRAKVDIDGKKESIREGEKAVITKSSIAINSLPVLLQKPDANSIFFSFDKSLLVQFAWELGEKEKIEYKNAGFLFEISKNRNFSDIYKKILIKDNKTEIPLPLGEFFWRVSIVDIVGKSLTSDVRKFRIIQDTALHLFNPVDGATIEYVSSFPLIHFSWQTNKYTSMYRVEISEDLAFQKIIKAIETSATRMAYQWELPLEPFQSKKCYWRVVTQYFDSKYPGQTSQIFQFSVKRKNELSAPSLVYPDDNMSLNFLNIKNEEIVFNWTYNADCKSTALYFAKDQNFKNVISQVTESTNYWTMKRPFPEGKYYWRVRCMSSENIKSEFSNVRSFYLFTIKDIPLNEPHDAAQYEFYDIEDDGIIFSWKRITSTDLYRFEIGNDRAFSSIFYSELTSTNSEKVTYFRPGSFYWRVFLLDNSEQEIIKSSTRGIKIHNRLQNPILHYPISGVDINMYDKDYITFQWKAVKSANAYKIMLFQIKKGNLKEPIKLIFSVETGDLQFKFTDIQKLDVGSFYWTLQALRRDGSSSMICSSDAVRSNFSINLKGMKGKIKIISPEVQIVK